MSSHIRTLSYECNFLFWSTMRVATTLFLCPSAEYGDFDSSLISAASENRPTTTTAFTNNMTSEFQSILWPEHWENFIRG